MPVRILGCTDCVLFFAHILAIEILAFALALALALAVNPQAYPGFRTLPFILSAPLGTGNGSALPGAISAEATALPQSHKFDALLINEAFFMVKANKSGIQQKNLTAAYGARARLGARARAHKTSANDPDEPSFEGG